MKAQMNNPREDELRQPATDDWADFPPREGPTLDTLDLAESCRRTWERDVAAMNVGTPPWVICVSETEDLIIAAARTAAQRSQRRLAVVKISAERVFNPWYGDTERRANRLLTRAHELAEGGDLVVLLLEHLDALLDPQGARSLPQVLRSSTKSREIRRPTLLSRHSCQHPAPQTDDPTAACRSGSSPVAHLEAIRQANAAFEERTLNYSAWHALGCVGMPPAASLALRRP